MDGDINQRVEDLKPTNVTGFFYYPISCNGTLVSSNARGFCLKTNERVALVLYIAHFQDSTFIEYEQHFLDAECYTFMDTATSVNGLEYYKGSISTKKQTTIKVTSGDYLVLRYKTVCEPLCHFQPAIVNESSKHTLYFSRTPSLAAGEQLTEISLLFTATIISGEEIELDHFQSHTNNNA